MAFIGISVPHSVGRLLSGIEVPGDKETTSSLHITLLCFADNVPISDIAKSMEAAYEVISKIKPFLVSVSTVSCFSPKKDKPTPIIAKVQSDELMELNKKLKKAFDKDKIEYSKVFKDYKPHITLSWHNEEIKDFKIDKLQFNVSEVVLWAGDEGDDRLFITFPLQGPQKKKALLHKIDFFEKVAVHHK